MEGIISGNDISDCRDIGIQIKGNWKINKPHLKKLCNEVRNLQQGFGFGNVSYKHIPRDKNQEADKLAKDAREYENINKNTKNKTYTCL